MTAALAGAPGAAFVVGTPGTGRDAAIIGAGVELQFASQVSLHLGYRGAFRSNSNAQEVAGGLRWIW
jgi:outer membrane autotransporter protein